MSEKQIRIAWSVILFGLCAFLLISFFSYDLNDIPFNTSNPNLYIQNWGGCVGAYFVCGLFLSIGMSAYFIPCIFFLWGIAQVMGRLTRNLSTKLLGFLLMLWSFSSMLSTLNFPSNMAGIKTGGVLGFFTSLTLIRYFGKLGALVILSTLFALSFLLATEFLIVPILSQILAALLKIVKTFFVKNNKNDLDSVAIANSLEKEHLAILPGEKLASNVTKVKRYNNSVDLSTALPLVKRVEPKLVIKNSALKKIKIPAVKIKVIGDYKLPGGDLLGNTSDKTGKRIILEDLEGNSKILEATLHDFGIDVKVVEVEQGPVITRYELQPAAGVKITRIANLGDDIALNLRAPSVHIVAPIPGKGTVGVEVPNLQAKTVYFREILESNEFQNSKSVLTLAIGKEVSGTPLMADLTEMPHILIAGATGSGKTVCVNTLIMSLLFQAGPEQVKLLLIDPKMVEMLMYNGLPHLICPVVTDVRKAAGALEWAVSEMEERYRVLAKVGVRNIASYNCKIEKGLKEIDDGDKKVELSLMPYIVIIIDELADLMLVCSKEVEALITRLAQLSRAVGIHLILATQRPSVDVITGIIKANFPARISFRVATKIDSRTVLDSNGADKLMGKGDMLFLKPGTFKLIRAQGGMVSDKEIENVVSFVKAQRSAVYSEEILTNKHKAVNRMNTVKQDDLLEEALNLVIDSKQASVSMLQRRLRLGYARAARLIDIMEDSGIVGQFRGSKTREVLVDTLEQAIALQQQQQPE
ncbi:MAG: hypothetical protein DRP78_00380 [Candidatus Omnitrophota bacterium]|nr:MAG: hypothetical protein DRP78_00380 [Candidatus Omnitrophota bacterium]